MIYIQAEVPLNTIAFWTIREGKGQWAILRQPNLSPEHRSYVICCTFGDCSGYRTLAECLAQDLHKDSPDDNWRYWIEER